MKSPVLVVRRAREKCLGLWVVIRLATDDGPDQCRKSAELERHTGVKSDRGSRWRALAGLTRVVVRHVKEAIAMVRCCEMLLP